MEAQSTIMIRIIFLLLLLVPAFTYAQTETTGVEDLKREILLLQADVENIQLNLSQSEKKFKRGIAVATVGYTMVIAGGLMLGRKNDELGKGLLIAGGVTGITGTIKMVDAFKYLERAGRKKSGSR
ncbi:MAG: hypothetical protein RI909_1893 [Bacteroidota bacterium]|jgi:hypothetical protein